MDKQEFANYNIFLALPCCRCSDWLSVTSNKTVYSDLHQFTCSHGYNTPHIHNTEKAIDDAKYSLVC